MEFQFSRAALGQALVATLQRQLNIIDVPPGVGMPPEGAVYLDHADVVGPPEWRRVEAAAQVQVVLQVALFVVTEQGLLARPNAEPDGAALAKMTPELVMQAMIQVVAATDTQPAQLLLKLVPQMPVEFAVLPQQVREKLTGSIASAAVTQDLSPLFRALKQPLPASGSLAIDGDLLVLRFDDAQPAGAKLPAGQDWVAFVESEPLVQTAQDAVPPTVEGEGWPIQSDARWAPIGGTPRVELVGVVRGQRDPLPMPFQAQWQAQAVISLASPSWLRTRTSWSLQAVDVAVLPDALDKLVADEVRPTMNATMLRRVSEQFDKRNKTQPVASTMTHGDDWVEVLDPLPVLSFGSIALRFAVVQADAAGMVLAGRLPVPEVPTARLGGTFRTFSRPQRLSFCSVLARSGNGAPPPTVGQWEAKCVASFAYHDGGAFLDAKVLRGAPSLADYLLLPQPGDRSDPQSAVLSLPAAIASGLEPLARIVIRTSRGVRCLDPGRANVKVDAEGNVTNAIISHIDDCLVMPEGWRGLRWGGLFDPHGEGGRRWRPVPLEHPDWQAVLGHASGFIVQRIRLAGLVPGEPVMLESTLQRLHLNADVNGRLQVPVLLPAGEELAAVLRCAASTPKQLRLRVDPLAFEARGGCPLEAAALEDLEPEDSPLRRVRARGRELMLNPQPLPPIEHPLVRAGGLAEVALADNWQAVVSVPGWPDREGAVAVLADGRGLLLEPTDGGARISGWVEGAIGAVRTSGDWAYAFDTAQPDRFRMFQMRRPHAG